jgi:hypothetical protein
MSEKHRKKKDGQDPNKKRRRMRDAVSERHQAAGPARSQRDEADTLTVKYKRGSSSDRSRPGAP